MIEKIFEKESLLERAEELRKKNFHPGFDNMDPDGAKIWISLNYGRLLADLQKGQYNPMPAIGFHTAKKSGGIRNLSRLTALDSILQMNTNIVLSAWNEEHFSDYSFAYRPGRGVSAAIRTYTDMAQTYPFAAKIDVISCFDNIVWEKLEASIQRFYGEKKLTDFLMKMAKMPVLEDGELCTRTKGILQGAPVSGLLCNLYYHPVDCLLEKYHYPFIRYADDLVIFSNDSEQIHYRYEMMSEYIEKELCLARNNRKCQIVSSDKLHYLGYQFRKDRHGFIALEADCGTVPAYYHWNDSKPRNNRRTSDLLSNGILRQKDFSLRFETEEKTSIIPTEATDIINVYSSVIFDAGVLNTAFRSGITINVFDRQNRLLGSFTPNTILKSPKVTHRQILAYYNERERLALSKDFVRASTHNAVLNIRYYNKQYPDVYFEHTLSEIAELDKKVKGVKTYENLLLLEANVRESYYQCFDKFLLSDEFAYEKRSRRPPKNEFNAMLSFGNTVLYNLIATEINKSPLDIRIGFLHASNHRLQSLNLDLAELFKPLIVDRTVFSLINRGCIHTDCFFQNEDGGVYLNEEGKHIFLTSFYSKMETQLMVEGKKMNYHQIIREEISKLVRFFRNESTYRAFRQIR